MQSANRPKPTLGPECFPMVTAGAAKSFGPDRPDPDLLASRAGHSPAEEYFFGRIPGRWSAPAPLSGWRTRGNWSAREAYGYCCSILIGCPHLPTAEARNATGVFVCVEEHCYVITANHVVEETKCDPVMIAVRASFL